MIDNTVHNNLTKAQFKAIKELRENNSLVTNQANKGGQLDVSLYSSIAFSILDNKNTYCKINFDPISSFKESLGNLLQEGIDLGIFTSSSM